jgi:hypothetical protein
MARPPSSLKFVGYNFLTPAHLVKRTGQVADKEKVLGFSFPRLSTRAGWFTRFIMLINLV